MKIIIGAVGALAATVAVAANPDVVFPAASGDLASGADWGGTLPTSAQSIGIRQSGTYSLSSDLSIGSVNVDAKNVVFDFTDGNHRLTLNQQSAGYNGNSSLFHSPYTYPNNNNAVTTLKGGVWYSPNKGTFDIVPWGSSYDYWTSYTFVATNGCVLTNIGACTTAANIRNCRTVFADNSRLYMTGRLRIGYHNGTNNVFEVASGAQANVGGNVMTDEKYSSTRDAYNRFDVHGTGSSMTVAGTTYLGYHYSFNGLSVRESAKFATASSVILGGNATATNNWLDVRDGAEFTANTLTCKTSGNSIFVSNATFGVTGTFLLGDSSAAHGNSLTLVGPQTVLSVTMQDFLGKSDSGAFGNQLTFAGGINWSPCANLTLSRSSNNVARVTGANTVLDDAFAETNGYHYTQFDWGTPSVKCRNNTLEISDGAVLKANRFFVHGYTNTVIVDNATLYAGSWEGNGLESGYSIWLGRTTANGCRLILRGHAPRVRSLHENYRPLMMVNNSVLRFELPAGGCPEGHVMLETGFVYMTSFDPATWSQETGNHIEIECADWAANPTPKKAEVVLLRAKGGISRDYCKQWIEAHRFNLPSNVRCFIRDNDLVLRRRGTAGLSVFIR